MSLTSIAKVRLTLAAEIVHVAVIEVETAADAAGGLVAAVVDAGGVEVVAADGTAVVMADTAAAEDDTRGGPRARIQKGSDRRDLCISIQELRLWSQLFFCPKEPGPRISRIFTD